MKEADALAAAGYLVQVIQGHSFPAYAAESSNFSDRAWSVASRVPFGALAPPGLRWKHRLRQRLAVLLCRVGIRPLAVVVRAWHPAGPDLIHAAKAVRADLYIAHYPPALPAAAMAARMHSGMYAFDAEDFHQGDFPENQAYDTQRSLLQAIESHWLPGCAFLTAASAGIAEAYASTYGLPMPTVIRNMFPLVQAPPGPTPCGSVQPGPTLYWFSQTIGPDRGLECAVRALALARCRPHLHLRGFINSAYRQQLEVLARQLGVEQRLHFHAPAPPEQMESLASAHDIGLVVETGCTPNRRIALTNKLFTYCLAGIPMLLSDIPAHRAVQTEAGDAAQLFRCEDAASLADALDAWLLGSPAVLAEARAAAYSLGQNRWNWESEQRNLLKLTTDVYKYRQMQDSNSVDACN